MQSIRVLQRYRINWVHAYLQRAIYFKELPHAIGAGGAGTSKICRVGWGRLEIQVCFGVSALNPKSTEQAFVCWSLFLPLIVVSMLRASSASNLWYMRQKENTKNQYHCLVLRGLARLPSSVCFICNVQGFQSYLGGGIRKSMYTLSSQKCSDFFKNVAELVSLVASEFSVIFKKAFFMPKSLRIHSWFLLELTIFSHLKLVIWHHPWD